MLCFVRKMQSIFHKEKSWKDRNRNDVRLGESPNQLVTLKCPTNRPMGHKRNEKDFAKRKWRKRKWLVSQVLTYLEKNVLKSV